MFNSSYLVYPGHGVCQNIGQSDTHLKLKTVINEMSILVPFHRIKDLGIRSIGTKDDAILVAQILISPAKHSNSTWNARYREFMEKIKQGDIFQIAEVVRDLIDLQKNKDLSFGERKMLDTAKDFLNTELECICAA